MNNGQIDKFAEHARRVEAVEKEKEKYKELAQKIRENFPQFTEEELRVMFPGVFR